MFVPLSLVALGVRLGCLFEIFLVPWGKTVIAINFPLRTAFAASHRFWTVVFFVVIWIIYYVSCILGSTWIKNPNNKKNTYIHSDPGSAVVFQHAFSQANTHKTAARPTPWAFGVLVESSLLQKLQQLYWRKPRLPWLESRPSRVHALPAFFNLTATDMFPHRQTRVWFSYFKEDLSPRAALTSSCMTVFSSETYR